MLVFARLIEQGAFIRLAEPKDDQPLRNTPYFSLTTRGGLLCGGVVAGDFAS
jgi:hypothetical protein